MDHQARGDHRHPRLFTSLRSASMAWTRPPGRIATSSPCGASMPTNRTPGRPRHHPRDQLRMHRTSRQNDGALMAPQRTSDRVTHRNGHRLRRGTPGWAPIDGSFPCCAPAATSPSLLEPAGGGVGLGRGGHAGLRGSGGARKQADGFWTPAVDTLKQSRWQVTCLEALLAKRRARSPGRALGTRGLADGRDPAALP
jgi:hypothetical protein